MQLQEQQGRAAYESYLHLGRNCGAHGFSRSMRWQHAVQQQWGRSECVCGMRGAAVSEITCLSCTISAVCVLRAYWGVQFAVAAAVAANARMLCNRCIVCTAASRAEAAVCNICFVTIGLQQCLGVNQPGAVEPSGCKPASQGPVRASVWHLSSLVCSRSCLGRRCGYSIGHVQCAANAICFVACSQCAQFERHVV